MTAILPVPAYALARAAWIPLVLCHADGRFTRLEGAPMSTRRRWRPADGCGRNEPGRLRRPDTPVRCAAS
jgi:hypothetical protein